MITIIDTPHVKHQTNNQETTSQIPLKQQKGGCYQTKQTSRKTQWRRNEKIIDYNHLGEIVPGKRKVAPVARSHRSRGEVSNRANESTSGFSVTKKNPTTTIFLHIFDTRSSLLHIYYQFLIFYPHPIPFSV